LTFIDLNFGIIKISLFCPTLCDQKIIGPLDVIFIVSAKTKNIGVKKIIKETERKISNNRFKINNSY